MGGWGVAAANFSPSPAFLHCCAFVATGVLGLRAVTPIYPCMGDWGIEEGLRAEITVFTRRTTPRPQPPPRTSRMARTLLLVLPFLAATLAWGPSEAEEHSVPKLPRNNSTLPKLRDSSRKLQEECDTGYLECPASAGGGCCPSGMQCTVNSCVELVCNTGFSLCPTSVGGGCCQTGYTCTTTKCIPPVGSSASGSTCKSTEIPCPAASTGCCDSYKKICGASGCVNRPKPDINAILAASKADKEKAEEEMGLGLPIGLTLAILALAAGLWSYRESLPCCKKDDSSRQVAPLTDE